MDLMLVNSGVIWIDGQVMLSNQVKFYFLYNNDYRQKSDI